MLITSTAALHNEKLVVPSFQHQDTKVNRASFPLDMHTKDIIVEVPFVMCTNDGFRDFRGYLLGCNRHAKHTVAFHRDFCSTKNQEVPITLSRSSSVDGLFLPAELT